MEAEGQQSVLEVRLLGGFQVTVDGVDVPMAAWRRRAAANLVQVLCLERTLRLHRDQVIDILWPELTVREAAPRLHKAAHYARSALGLPGAVVLQDEVVNLLPSGRVTVDLHVFDDAAAVAEAAQIAVRSATPEGSEAAQEAARDKAERALALYVGDLLIDDPYAPWAEEARESRRLHRLRLLRQAGRWEELADADPTDEEAHVRLAHSLALRGDRSAALHTLDRLEGALVRELGLEPGDTVAQLRKAVLAAPVTAPLDPLAQQTASSPAPRATPLPAPASRLVGRGEEIAQALSLLDSSRILTLLGPGGVGKTTLAVEVARLRSEQSGAEAAFVDLTEVHDSALVPGFVAGELGIHHARDAQPELAMAEAVSGRRLLVLLDNFEHVIDGAGLVSRLASWSADLEVITTTRTRLRLTDERVLAVEPFAVPPEDLSEDHLRHNDAVVLFSQVAKAVDPGFEPARHLEDVAAICRSVDGLPLAITLAAGHARTLPPALLRTRLAGQLGSPHGAPRDAPSRQRTVAATIEWSLQLLGRSDVRLFTRLGVFTAPASLGAIEAICSDPGEDPISSLSRLVDHSLVQRSGDGIDARFRMLALVRERSRALLDDSPDGATTRERHARHVLAELERIDSGRWKELAATWIGTVTAILPEIRAAYAWARDEDDLLLCARIVGALGTFWLREGHHVEARTWVADVLPERGRFDRGVAGRVLVAAALLCWTQDPALARDYWAEAVENFRAIGDNRYLSYALGLSAGSYMFAEGLYEEALAMSYEAIAIGREVGDRPLLAQSLNVLGELARNQGDDNLAEKCYLEALALAEESGDRAHRCVLLANQAYLASHRQDHDEALRLAREALSTSWSLGLRMVTAWTLSEIASPLLGLGQAPLAAVLVGAADRALDTLGVGRQLGDQGEYQQVIRSLRETLGDEAYEINAADGARLTLAEAVGLALRPDGEPRPIPGSAPD